MFARKKAPAGKRPKAAVSAAASASAASAGIPFVAAPPDANFDFDAAAAAALAAEQELIAAQRVKTLQRKAALVAAAADAAHANAQGTSKDGISSRFSSVSLSLVFAWLDVASLNAAYCASRQWRLAAVSPPVRANVTWQCDRDGSISTSAAVLRVSSFDQAHVARTSLLLAAVRRVHIAMKPLKESAQALEVLSLSPLLQLRALTLQLTLNPDLRLPPDVLQRLLRSFLSPALRGLQVLKLWAPTPIALQLLQECAAQGALAALEALAIGWKDATFLDTTGRESLSPELLNAIPPLPRLQVLSMPQGNLSITQSALETLEAVMRLCRDMPQLDALHIPTHFNASFWSRQESSAVVQQAIAERSLLPVRWLFLSVEADLMRLVRAGLFPGVRTLVLIDQSNFDSNSFPQWPQAFREQLQHLDLRLRAPRLQQLCNTIATEVPLLPSLKTLLLTQCEEGYLPYLRNTLQVHMPCLRELCVRDAFFWGIYSAARDARPVLPALEIIRGASFFGHAWKDAAVSAQELHELFPRLTQVLECTVPPGPMPAQIEQLLLMPGMKEITYERPDGTIARLTPANAKRKEHSKPGGTLQPTPTHNEPAHAQAQSVLVSEKDVRASNVEEGAAGLKPTTAATAPAAAAASVAGVAAKLSALELLAAAANDEPDSDHDLDSNPNADSERAAERRSQLPHSAGFEQAPAAAVLSGGVAHSSAMHRSSRDPPPPVVSAFVKPTEYAQAHPAPAGVANQLSLISLSLVFQCLEAPDLMRANRCCRQWREAAINPLVMRPKLRVWMDEMKGIQVAGPQITFSQTAPLAKAAQSKLFRNLRILRLSATHPQDGHSSMPSVSEVRDNALAQLAFVPSFHSLHTLSLELRPFALVGSAWDSEHRKATKRAFTEFQQAHLWQISAVFASAALKHVKLLRLQMPVGSMEPLLPLVASLSTLEGLELRALGGTRHLRSSEESEDDLEADGEPVLFQYAKALRPLTLLRYVYISAPPHGRLQHIRATWEDVLELERFVRDRPALEEVAYRIPLDFGSDADDAPVQIREFLAGGVSEWPLVVPKVRSVFLASMSDISTVNLSRMSCMFPDLLSLSIGGLYPMYPMYPRNSAHEMWPAYLCATLQSLTLHVDIAQCVEVLNELVAAPQFPALVTFQLSLSHRLQMYGGAERTNEVKCLLDRLFERMPVLQQRPDFNKLRG